MEHAATKVDLNRVFKANESHQQMPLLNTNSPSIVPANSEPGPEPESEPSESAPLLQLLLLGPSQREETNILSARSPCFSISNLKMEKWQITALVLCCFGLFKEFRPSEPFVTDYIKEYYNITVEVVIHDAYPVSTYSCLSTLAIVFLVTDFLRYRSVVIFEGLAYVTTYVLLTWGRNLTVLYLVEIMYGLASSTEVAYYTYIYAQVDKDKYKKVTSYTYTAILVGRFFAGLTAQVLTTTHLMTYHQLNYLSLAGVSLALVFSLFLPPVRQSIYFYRGDDENAGEISSGSASPKSNRNRNRSTPMLSFTQRIRRAYPILWKDFKSAFSNSYVNKWSIWWGVGTAVNLQVVNYVQAMWDTIEVREEGDSWNAAVESIYTFMSAIFSLGVGYVNTDWTKWGDLFLSSMSIVASAALVVLSQTSNIYAAYVCYVLFRLIFQVSIVVASAEVAQQISDDSYGLIFGVNTFLALSIQTIFTVTVSDSRGLKLRVEDQFIVYGGCFALLGFLYLIVAVFKCFKYGCRRDSVSERL